MLFLWFEVYFMECYIIYSVFQSLPCLWFARESNHQWRFLLCSRHYIVHVPKYVYVHMVYVILNRHSIIPRAMKNPLQERS